MRMITMAQFEAEGEKRFGPDQMQWKFVCPSCGHVASAADYKAAGAPSTAVGFSCVGRWLGADNSHTFTQDGGPCTYAGGGLISLNPVHIEGMKGRYFEFAEVEHAGAEHE